uniref:Uncharacterized protein n=1 Tax=Siphoviridae sp. ctZHD14 TaxID=2827891 RepID=A0A8S5SW69_9CAUD|nr:MAG TPA: hypothetical protein [Siphoviridae sp. ctZHD14]
MLYFSVNQQGSSELTVKPENGNTVAIKMLYRLSPNRVSRFAIDT